MLTDPIADMLTRIRNANTAKHDDVKMPSSKQKVALAKILHQEGYITDFSVAPATEGSGRSAQHQDEVLATIVPAPSLVSSVSRPLVCGSTAMPARCLACSAASASLSYPPVRD